MPFHSFVEVSAPFAVHPCVDSWNQNCDLDLVPCASLYLGHGLDDGHGRGYSSRHEGGTDHDHESQGRNYLGLSRRDKKVDSNLELHRKGVECMLEAVGQCTGMMG